MLRLAARGSRSRRARGRISTWARLCTTCGASARPIAAYREALRLRPDFADAHNNRAYSLLLSGRYAGRLA